MSDLERAGNIEIGPDGSVTFKLNEDIAHGNKNTENKKSFIQRIRDKLKGKNKTKLPSQPTYEQSIEELKKDTSKPIPEYVNPEEQIGSRPNSSSNNKNNKNKQNKEQKRPNPNKGKNREKQRQLNEERKKQQEQNNKNKNKKKNKKNSKNTNQNVQTESSTTNTQQNSTKNNPYYSERNLDFENTRANRRKLNDTLRKGNPFEEKIEEIIEDTNKSKPEYANSEQQKPKTESINQNTSNPTTNSLTYKDYKDFIENKFTDEKEIGRAFNSFMNNAFTENDETLYHYLDKDGNIKFAVNNDNNFQPTKEQADSHNKLKELFSEEE